MSVNKTILIGRLGQDPELKQTQNGNSVCNLSIATTESWNDKSGQKQSKTEWHRVNIWGKQAENCNKYLSKGSQVYVEGKIETRSWDDDQGNKRYSTEIVANNIQFLQTNKDTNEALQNAHAANENGASVASDVNFASDDIPF